MRTIAKVTAAAVLLLFGAAGCADLEVTNPNDPDREKALATAGDVESLIAGSYSAWFNGNFSYNTQGLNKASFESSAMAANFGNLEVSGIPRAALPNRTSYTDLGIVIERMWVRSYRALSALSDGIATLDNNEDLAAELGAEAEARARAWGRFVQALGHATLAVYYDKAYLLDETTDVTQEQTAVPWPDVATRAYELFGEAITLASGASWVIPASWIGTLEDVPADKIVELAHSYRALFRAAMPRVPSDVVDWGAVIADLDEGLTEDFMMEADPSTFYDGAFDINGGPNGWAFDAYFIIGMADQSDRYQDWLAVPVGDRLPYFGATSSDEPFIIETPDTRFPQGTTLTAQIANPGEYYVIPTEDSEWGYGFSEHLELAGRGTWRWSYYYYPTSFDYWFSIDFSIPLIKAVELDLLRAEALLETGMQPQAALIVDATRTAHGLDSSVDGINDSCVPKLPNGDCGDFMEMLKWEKRLETRSQGALFRISWYWDSRRWGDHYAGTPLQFPIPVSDLETLQLEAYTFGGAEPFGSPGSTYDWPDEN